MGAHLNTCTTKELWDAAYLELVHAGTLTSDDGKNLFHQLRISYDGLETQRVKDVFLDIACLMLGRTDKFALGVWGSR